LSGLQDGCRAGRFGAGISARQGSACQITEEELDSLEVEANKNIDLKEFIPLASVDPVYFENTHYLGPEKGGEKPYRLLADAMMKSGRVAIAVAAKSTLY
jgi:DNA end-binding protein Ku